MSMIVVCNYEVFAVSWDFIKINAFDTLREKKTTFCKVNCKENPTPRCLIVKKVLQQILANHPIEMLGGQTSLTKVGRAHNPLPIHPPPPPAHSTVQE